MRPSVRIIVAAAALAILGCSNAGEDLILNVTATGVVRGVVAFDLNGDLRIDAGDDSVKDVRVTLRELGPGDSVKSALSAVSGQYVIRDVPVGVYRIVVDTTRLADTAVIAKLDSAQVTLHPGDTITVNVLAGYPHLSIRAARTTVPLGRRVFVEGIVLNSPFTFRDTTMHVQDTSAAIRTTRIRSSGLFPADSIRLRGTTSQRSGQRTLDDVTAFGLGSTFLPPVVHVTTAVAATAQNGQLDARQAQVTDATISDTATVGQDFRLTVSDGSGALEVLLDGTADAAFRPPLLPGQYIPGNKFDIVGLLVPTGTTGLWRLKPRSAQELTKK